MLVGSPVLGTSFMYRAADVLSNVSAQSMAYSGSTTAGCVAASSTAADRRPLTVNAALSATMQPPICSAAPPRSGTRRGSVQTGVSRGTASRLELTAAVKGKLRRRRGGGSRGGSSGSGSDEDWASDDEDFGFSMGGGNNGGLSSGGSGGGRSWGGHGDGPFGSGGFGYGDSSGYSSGGFWLNNVLYESYFLWQVVCLLSLAQALRVATLGGKKGVQRGSEVLG